MQTPGSEDLDWVPTKTHPRLPGSDTEPSLDLTSRQGTLVSWDVDARAKLGVDCGDLWLGA